MFTSRLNYSRDIEAFCQRLLKRQRQTRTFFKTAFTVLRKPRASTLKPVILTEGDSWFDYPLKSLTEVMGSILKHTIGLKNFGVGSHTNVIDHLIADKHVNGLFLRLERSGDTSPDLVAKVSDGQCGVAEKSMPSHTLFEALSRKEIAEQTQFILLSAGGNDMVNRAQRHSILEYDGSWQSSYDPDILQDEADRVVSHYIGAIQLRDQYAPQAHIITHSYCYATHTSKGSPIQFDMKEVGFVKQFLLKLFNLSWLKIPLKSVGLNLSELGEITIDTDAHLHKVFDKKGWPENQGESVHPERQAFIKVLLDALYDAMYDIPQRYHEVCGEGLERFDLLDIREECQDARYWADYIHLNPLGYQRIKDCFKNKLLEYL